VKIGAVKVIFFLNEITFTLEYDAVAMGNWIPTFRGKVVPSKAFDLCQLKQHHIPEGRNPQLHRCEHIKTRNPYDI
jgi:hypothetical protein